MGTRRFQGAALALAMFALAAPAVAQATESHWFAHRKEIPRGATDDVGSSGKLAIDLLTGPQAGTEVKCKVAYKGEVWNPAPKGAGEGLIDEMSFPKCNATPAFCKVTSKLPVAALGLPWQLTLFREQPSEGGREGDELEGMQVEVHCAGGESTALEGGLTGTVGVGRTDLKGTMQNGAQTVEATVELSLAIKGHGAISIGP